MEKETIYCPQCGGGMKLDNGPFSVKVDNGRRRVLRGAEYFCTSCKIRRPSRELESSVLNAESW